MFGKFLEGRGIFVAKEADRAHGKSNTPGIDLEFERGGKRYLVAIKSGPVWGNKDQIARMRDNFRTAKRIYNQDPNALPVECVNGCCYGKQPRAVEHKGDYIKLCGQ